jgi:hypothetical protein
LASPLVESSKNSFRTWFRKVWEVRGGGLFACGFAAAFVIFEIGSLADDITGIGAVFNGEVISFMLGFIIDSFMNTFYALIWPVYVLQWAPPWGAIALGIAYWLFPTFVKPHIEGWLFDGESAQAEEPEKPHEPESAGGP